ncbi:hypothetical protein ACVWZA_003813 [Sphingomonas sp. UYAg733]
MEQYRALYNTIKTYWREYGGWYDWASSPFFHISLAISVANLLEVISINWRSLARESLPTILGFSLAAYTITFTLMGSTLHTALRSAINEKRGISLHKMVNVTFFHVVFFQILALLFSIITSGDFIYRNLTTISFYRSSFIFLAKFIVSLSNFVGCFLVVYAVCLLLSIAIAMLRLGRLSGSASAVAASPQPVAEASTQTPVVLQLPDHPGIRETILKLIRRALRLPA